MLNRFEKNDKVYFKRINHIVDGISNFLPFDSVKEAKIKKDNIENDDIFYNMLDDTLGFSKKIMDEIMEYNNYSARFVIKEDDYEQKLLVFDFDKDLQLLDKLLIEVEKGASFNLLIVYKGNKKAYHNGVLKLIAKNDSRVKITILDFLEKNSENYHNISLDAHSNAKIEYYEARFGNYMSAISCRANLIGDNSEILILPTYFADLERKMDLEYTLKFYGRRAIGNIDARGVTKDKARKVFRGNLIFEKGSTKSAGEEGEFSIILSKNVNAQSIPTLFCKEDDVIGAHSANIGKIDENKLLYLMSRGLTEKEARKMVVLSSIKPILENIDFEEYREIINNELDSRL